jgi:hypothetical protein
MAQHCTRGVAINFLKRIPDASSNPAVQEAHVISSPALYLVVT